MRADGWVSAPIGPFGSRPCVGPLPQKMISLTVKSLKVSYIKRSEDSGREYKARDDRGVSVHV